jgi:hypothetical protein
MLTKLKYLFNKFTGQRYWYVVHFSYKNKENYEVFNYKATVDLAKKHLIIDDKAIKKRAMPLHLQKRIPKRLLSNGTLNMTVDCYLGCFKDKRS